MPDVVIGQGRYNAIVFAVRDVRKTFLLEWELEEKCYI